jgi:hypothetical protein
MGYGSEGGGLKAMGEVISFAPINGFPFDKSNGVPSATGFRPHIEQGTANNPRIEPEGKLVCFPEQRPSPVLSLVEAPNTHEDNPPTIKELTEELRKTAKELLPHIEEMLASNRRLSDLISSMHLRPSPCDNPVVSAPLPLAGEEHERKH